MREKGLHYTSKHRLWIATSGNPRQLVRGSPLKPLVKRH